MSTAKEPLVSAVITTHNRLDLVVRAIDSVQRQTYKNIELILVDDASTDGTDELCLDKPFKYIYIAPQDSRGGNYARNRGIQAAKGKYIAFLDDDDYWLPKKIEKQVELIERKNCELVHCGRINEIITVKGIVMRESLPNPVHYGDMRKKILQTICTTTSAILVKKDALMDIGMFDENLGFWQEYELTIRLAQRKPFYFTPECLLVYRVDSQDKQRLTNKYFEWKKSVAYIYKKHKGLYRRLSFFERIEAENMAISDGVARSKASGLCWRSRFLKCVWFIREAPFAIVRRMRRKLSGQIGTQAYYDDFGE